MLTFNDFSARRGAMVPLLAQIYDLVLACAAAAADKRAIPTPPENFIFWRQRIYKELVEVPRRWLLAMDGKAVAGVLFYRREAAGIYIDALHIAPSHPDGDAIVEGLLAKLALDPIAKEADFFACATVAGAEDGGSWVSLGRWAEAKGALTLRYTKA